MLPDHCRHVSLRKVNFELTQNIIENELLGSKIYKGTDYLILNKGEVWCVVRIRKTPRRGLFWEVTSIEIISGVNNTIYYSDPKINVLNKNSMAQLFDKFPDKTVVVKGKFEHISFLAPEPVIELIALDVIPPEPPKIIELVKDVLNYISFSKPIKIIEKVIDIKSMLKPEQNEIFLLPCNASGLEGEEYIKFLDEFPEISKDDVNNITLVGCELSLRIFIEVYGSSPKFINICPVKLADDIPKNKPVLIKCCKAKSFERRDNLFIVPWGTTYKDIEKALEELISIT
jgi:hypothetical protein